MADDFGITDADLESAANTVATRRAQAVNRGLEQDPDKAASAMQLSETTGRPAPAILDNYDQYTDDLKGLAAREIVNSNPALRSYVDREPMAGAISSDDWPTLDDITKGNQQDTVLMRMHRALHAPFASADPMIDEMVTAFKQGYGSGYDPERANKITERYGSLAAAGDTAAAEALHVLPGLFNGFLSAAAAGTADIPGFMTLDRLMTGGVERSKEAAVGELTSNLGAVLMDEGANAAAPKGPMLAGLKAGLPWFEVGRDPPKGLHPELDRAKADLNAEAMTELDQKLAQALTSPTRGRSPEMFSKLLGHDFGDTEFELAATGARSLYAEGERPHPGDSRLGDIPGVEEQWDEMLADPSGKTGIGIKDRDWLAHVLPEVNDAVKDDRRAWPGGITAREAAEEPPVMRAVVDAPLAQVRAVTGTEPLVGMGDRALTLDSGTVTEAGEHGFTLKDENGAEVGSVRVIPPDADGVLRVTGVDGPAQLWSDTFGPALTRDLKRQLAAMYPEARTIEAVRPEGAEPKLASLDLTGPETVESHKAMQEVLGYAGHPDVGVHFAGPGEAGNEYQSMADHRGVELSPMSMNRHWSSVRDETGAKLGTKTNLPEWFHDVKAVLKTLADKLGYTFDFPVLVGTTRGPFGAHYGTGHIILSDKLKRADAIATALHEFGHSVELNKFTDLPMADKQAIIDAWQKSPSKGKTARELRPITENAQPDGSIADRPIEKLADQSYTYVTNFREWFAEQVSRWITKNATPTGVVEKFFHGIGQVWRAIYEKVTGHYGVAPEVNAFMRKNWQGDVDIQLPPKEAPKVAPVAKTGGGSGGEPPKPPGETATGAPQPTPGRQPLEEFVQSLVNQTMASTSEMQAKAVGITAKAWEKLKTLMAKQSEDDINANLKRAARAEAERQKPEWSRKLAEVTQEVSTALSKRRDIALDRFLGEGMVGDQKVQQRFTLREADLTPEQVAALPEHYVSKNGLPVAAVGKQLGYHTIEEMVADLNKLHQARLKPDGSRMRMSDYMRKLIQDESAKEMERRHGNFQDNVMEAAMKQVTSENQVARIHAEYEAAAQAAGQKAIDKKVIAQAARNMLDGTLVKKVGSFEAMQKAGALGKKAHEALIAGKPLEMFNHLQGQTLLMHVAKAMRDVEDEIAEFEKNAKIDLKRTPKGRDFEYTDYLHEIYIKLGMKPRRSIEDIKRQHELREGQPIKTLEEFVNEKTADGAEIFPMPEMFDPAYAVKWKEMTTEDFLAAKSFIDSMRVAAKTQHQVNIFGQHLLIDAIMPDMLMAGDKYKEYLPKTAEDTKVSDARRMFSSVVMPQFLVNRLDGWLSTGAWNKYFMNMLQSGYGDKLRYQRELAKVMQQIADRPEWKEGIDNPGIFMMPKEHGGRLMEMTRENLIAAMLNIGTKSGLKQLARGFGIKKPAVIEEWIHENANEEDWDFVRTVWNDVFKRTGGWVEEMYAREGLRVPRMLSGRTIDTPFGPIEGAYYPIIYDRVMGTPRFAKGMGDQALYGGKLTESFMPASGYTKDRLGSGNRISLSLDLLPAKAEEQIHDAAMRPAVRNALKILGRPEIEKMFNTRIGREYYDSLLATVKRAAGQDTASAKQSATMQVVSKWLDWATHRMIGSLIGFNPGTFVKHGTSALVNSAQSVGVRPFLAALKDLHEIGPEGDKLRAFVAEHSDAMRERNRTVMNSFYGSTQEVTQPKSGWETWQSNINDAGHAPVIWGDSVSAAPTFVAAFRRAKKNGLSDGQAVLEADTAIRTTHGSTSDINKSTMMAELPTWLSWFGNFFNDLTNRGIESFYKAGEAQRLWKDGSPESMARAKQLAWQSTSQLLVAVVVPALIHRFMDPDIHKKGESLPWYMAKEAIYDTTMFIPGLRELGHYLTGTQSPTIGALSSIMEVPGRLYKDFDSSKWQTPQAREREIKDTLMLFGTALGLPGGAMGNAGSALYGLATGQERPQGFMDVWRLATRGTTREPKKE